MSDNYRGGKGGTPSMKEPNASESNYNSGRMTSKANFGQTVVEEYGLDRSAMIGDAKCERGTPIKGSATDLSHSISGASAVQNSDRSHGGRKDTIKLP